MFWQRKHWRKKLKKAESKTPLEPLDPPSVRGKAESPPEPNTPAPTPTPSPTPTPHTQTIGQRYPSTSESTRRPTNTPSTNQGIAIVSQLTAINGWTMTTSTSNLSRTLMSHRQTYRFRPGSCYRLPTLPVAAALVRAICMAEPVRRQRQQKTPGSASALLPASAPTLTMGVTSLLSRHTCLCHHRRHRLPHNEMW